MHVNSISKSHWAFDSFLKHNKQVCEACLALHRTRNEWQRTWIYVCYWLLSLNSTLVKKKKEASGKIKGWCHNIPSTTATQKNKELQKTIQYWTFFFLCHQVRLRCLYLWQRVPVQPTSTSLSLSLCGDTIKETGIYYLKAERYTVAAGFMSRCNIYKACESTLLKSPMPFICQSHDFHWLTWRMISLMFMTN